MKPAALKRALKGHDVYVNDVHGTAYATNKYWLAPATVLEPLLAEYNLAVESGKYDINGSVTRSEHAPPNLAPLMDKFVAATKIGVCPVRESRRLLYFKGGDDCALFERSNDGLRFGLNAGFLEMILGEGWEGALDTFWFAQDEDCTPLAIPGVTPRGPRFGPVGVAHVVREGSVATVTALALIMPVSLD